MALIKCPECGNEVSEKANVCPHCGNPIGQKTKEKISTNKILSLAGSVLIAISPLLAYVTINYNFPFNPTSDSYNMWSILSPEAGGLKSGDSAGFFGFVPTIIMVLGIAGALMTILQIVKKIEINVFIRALIPILSIVLLILFEAVGLVTFRETNNTILEVFNEQDLGDIVSITKGIGFYLLIVGVVVSIVALFMKTEKKVQEE